MRRLAFRLWLLLRHSDPRIVEFGNALLACAWGLWLLLPWASWGSSIIYRPLLLLAPEHAWGIVYAAIGGAHMAVALSDWYQWRRWFSFISVIKWTLVVALFAIGHLHATATVVYGAIAVASAWVFIRIGLTGPQK